MPRFINFALILLIIIAFLFGVRIGKQVQRIDTPIKTIYKTKWKTQKVYISESISPVATKSSGLFPTKEVTN